MNKRRIKMSVNCEMFIGWTVKLIEGDVTNQDFDFFHELEEKDSDFEAFKGRRSHQCSYSLGGKCVECETNPKI